MDHLAFDPIGVTKDGLVYTTLSCVRTIDSLYLISKLVQQNFHVKNKIVNEMARLETIGAWELEFAKKRSNNNNVLSIASLNTRSIHAHLSNVIHHKDLMDNMVLCFQETHLHIPPIDKESLSFNFAIAHSTHGILTCKNKKIIIKATKTFYKNKTELTLINMYFQQPIFLTNTYAAPFEKVSTIIQMIKEEKSQTSYTNYVLLVISDFNIDIHYK